MPAMNDAERGKKIDEYQRWLEGNKIKVLETVPERNYVAVIDDGSGPHVVYHGPTFQDVAKRAVKTYGWETPVLICPVSKEPIVRSLMSPIIRRRPSLPRRIMNFLYR